MDERRIAITLTRTLHPHHTTPYTVAHLVQAISGSIATVATQWSAYRAAEASAAVAAATASSTAAAGYARLGESVVVAGADIAKAVILATEARQAAERADRVAAAERAERQADRERADRLAAEKLAREDRLEREEREERRFAAQMALANPKALPPSREL